MRTTITKTGILVTYCHWKRSDSVTISCWDVTFTQDEATSHIAASFKELFHIQFLIVIRECDQGCWMEKWISRAVVCEQWICNHFLALNPSSEESEDWKKNNNISSSHETYSKVWGNWSSGGLCKMRTTISKIRRRLLQLKLKLRRHNQLLRRNFYARWSY